MTLVKATLLKCDNPECDTQPVIYDKLNEPDGYYIQGYWIDSSGGAPFEKLYACSKDCIVPAMIYAKKGYNYES